MIEALIADYPFWPTDGGLPSPYRVESRSQWLGFVEDILREHYPQSSSADRRLTARGLAPFPLKDGPNVP